VDLPVVEMPLAIAPPPALPSPPPWPPAIEPAKLTVEEPPLMPFQVADTNPLIYREPSPGDTPMLRNWQSLALCSLITTTFVQVTAPAVAGEKEKTVLERLEALDKTIKKSFEGVQADIKAVREELENVKKDGLKHGRDLTAAEDNLKKVEKSLGQLTVDVNLLRNRDTAARPAIDKASMDQLKSKLGDIEQAILKLLPSTNRISLASPSTSTTGRVMLVNLYPEELLFVVNQKSYRVLPGVNTPLDNVAAGALTYEVISPTWGSRARNTTTLSPNETFTLTAR
jgi:hypothetical protein